MEIDRRLKVMMIGQYPKECENEKQVFTGIMTVVYGITVCLESHSNLEVEIAFKELNHIESRFKKAIKFITNLIHTDANIFHIHGIGITSFFSIFIGILRHKKIIYTAHGLVSRENKLGYNYPSIWSFYEFFLFNYSNIITTVSKNMQEMIIQDYKIERRKIIVIENGVSSEFFPYKPIRYLNSELSKYYKEKLFILFVGGTRKVKGLEFLFESIKGLSEKITLLIVGKEGDQHEILISKYEDLIKEGYVKFLGKIPQNELIALYQLDYIFVLPSFYEPFGLVPLEAMAKGKPIIVSDRVGASSIITNMKDGMIVPFGDVKSLTKAINLLIKNPIKRKQIGLNARKTAKKHTWERVAKKYLACYQLLSGELYR